MFATNVKYFINSSEFRIFILKVPTYYMIVGIVLEIFIVLLLMCFEQYHFELYCVLMMLLSKLLPNNVFIPRYIVYKGLRAIKLVNKRCKQFAIVAWIYIIIIDWFSKICYFKQQYSTFGLLYSIHRYIFLVTIYWATLHVIIKTMLS